MSYTVPTNIPAQARAGATFTFKLSLADFSASESWAVTYSLRLKNGSAISFTSAASGSDHLVEVPYSTTASWMPGTYSGVAVVSNGTQKFEVWKGKLSVLPDVANSPEGSDLRSIARRTLDNIEAVIEGRASSTVLNSSVEGTSLSRIPHADLIMLRDRYVEIVAAEDREEDAANGVTGGRAIFTVFTSPR